VFTPCANPGLYTSQTHFVTMKNSLNDLHKNRFESVLAGCKTYRKPKRKAPVTIIIALVGKDHITIASDSRTTNPDGTINDNTQKIKIVKLGDAEMIVAQAGHADMGSKAMQILIEKSASKSLTNYWTPPVLINVSVLAGV